MQAIRAVPQLMGSRPARQTVVSALFTAVGVVALLRTNGDGTQIAVVPTLIALTAKKFFGKDKGDPETALADHPGVAFVLGALTTGDTQDAEEYIDANSVSYANGYEMLDPESGDSPAQFVDNVNFWRTHVPDLSMSVYDEIVKKHRHKKQDVAVRFVMSGTMPGGGPEARFSFEGAAFVRVVAGKATEWRLILDSHVMETMLVSIAGERSEEG